MSYDPQVWTDPADGAAFSATRLNHMENGISDAHQLIADLQAAPPSTPTPPTPTAGGVPGVVQVDSFGGNDTAKMTAALSYAAAQTQRPWLQLPARTFNTGAATFGLFTGCKIVGAGIAFGAKNLEVSGGVGVIGKWQASPGIESKALLQATSTVYDVNILGVAFQGGPGSQLFRSTVNAYACAFGNLNIYGFKHAFGSTAEKFLMTQVIFSGHWTVLGFTDTPFHLGGSDSALWQDGYVNINTPSATKGNGRPAIVLDSLGKTVLGYVYLTAENDWTGLVVKGALDRSCTILGGTYEGRSETNVATRPLIDVQGGHVTMFGPHLGQVASNSATVAGVITQSGGNLTVYSPTYKRGTAAAPDLPLLYQTGGVAQLYHPVATTGEQVRVRWSSGTVETLAAPANGAVG